MALRPAFLVAALMWCKLFTSKYPVTECYRLECEEEIEVVFKLWEVLYVGHGDGASLVVVAGWFTSDWLSTPCFLWQTTNQLHPVIQKRSRGNELIHRRLSKTKSI